MIYLKKDELIRHMRKNNISSKYKLSKLLNISYVHIYRIFKNQRNPGQAFVSAVLSLFNEACFDDFFYIEKRGENK